MSKELKEIWDGIPPGRKCIVKIDNATMHIRIGHSSYMHSIRSKDIQKGSVIEICGSEDVDGIPVTTVSDSDGDSGTFWPNDFGNIRNAVLYLLSVRTVLNLLRDILGFYGLELFWL